MNSAVLKAIQEDRAGELRHLIQEGADPNYDARCYSPLCIAAANDAVECIYILLKHGADIDKIRGGDTEGFTALFIAITNKKEVSAIFLIQEGAQINISDEEGYTPLHYAVMNGCISVAECLLRHGANLKAVSKKGETIFDVVYEANMRELLTAYLPDVNASTEETSFVYNPKYTMEIFRLLKTGIFRPQACL